MSNKSTKQSEIEYDVMHDEYGFQEETEYYKLLGTLLRGKSSVDLGCGFGFISTYSPETVGVDFSEKALEIAKKRGVKHVVKASVENLPFNDDEFEIAVSNGTLEHISNINAAISEMIRVSEVQIYIVHAALPYGLELIRRPMMKLLKLEEQPIENPQTLQGLKEMIKQHGARVLIEGVWNYVDFRWIHPKIPYGIVKWPSHHFIISIKTPNQERQFLGDLERLRDIED